MSLKTNSLSSIHSICHVKITLKYPFIYYFKLIIQVTNFFIYASNLAHEFVYDNSNKKLKPSFLVKIVIKKTYVSNLIHFLD